MSPYDIIPFRSGLSAGTMNISIIVALFAFFGVTNNI